MPPPSAPIRQYCETAFSLPRPAAPQQIGEHGHAAADEQRGGVGHRIARGPRADAIDQRVGADRQRGQQRIAHPARIDPQRAAVAKRQQQARLPPAAPARPSRARVKFSPSSVAPPDRGEQRRAAARDRIDLAEIAVAIGLDQACEIDNMHHDRRRHPRPCRQSWAVPRTPAAARRRYPPQTTAPPSSPTDRRRP